MKGEPLLISLFIVNAFYFNRRLTLFNPLFVVDFLYIFSYFQPVGRVKIQVYRGPSKGEYDFAPWGYYNTQPADLAIHH